LGVAEKKGPRPRISPGEEKAAVNTKSMTPFTGRENLTKKSNRTETEKKNNRLPVRRGTREGNSKTAKGNGGGIYLKERGRESWGWGVGERLQGP